ncbi:hypothetical protein SDC9_204317 [bioreactor metagenome]|uniref:Uncharacterized protein n=1 Tax=bioreactor metagenome TaxID=1076179 RepID=A0A645IZN8_9ZZZZ
MTAEQAMAIFKLPLEATPMAMGAMAAMVPMEVPMAVEIKQEIRKMPGINREAGMKRRPRLTTESTPPMALAAPWKPPASR